MTERLVSQRQAAAALGLASSTFRGLVRAEATLAACAVGTGPRGARLYDLAKLRRAWGRLRSADPAQAPVGDRAAYSRNRLWRLWFDLCSCRQELRDLEAAHVDARSAREALRALHDEVRTSAQEWAASETLAAAAGLRQGEARQLVQASVVAALEELTGRAEAVPPPEPPVGLTPPDPMPTLWALKAALEGQRAKVALTRLRVARGDLEPAGAVTDRFFTQGRFKRDAWQRAGERLALQTRRLRDAAAVKTAALQLLSAEGLI